MQNERIKVLYIMGCGRSGSTVLDTVLGNATKVESVGELCNLGRAISSENEYCACGLLARNCQFWKEVSTQWRQMAGTKYSFDQWVSLQRKVEQYRNIPNLFNPNYLNSEEFISYSAGLSALFHSLAINTGKDVIVDSSKGPMRALAISKNKHLDLKVIHLVRDGRGVSWSLKKGNRKDPAAGVQREIRSKPIWRTALAWVRANLASEGVLTRIEAKDKIRIRYEDFIDNPIRQLVRIEAFSGVEMKAVIDKLNSSQEFYVGHTIAGNRARMAGRIKLEADYSWHQNLTRGDRIIFGLIAGPLSRRYGY